MARLTRTDLLAADAVWLFVLTYAGQTYYIATERADISSVSPAGNSTLSFRPGLTPLTDIVQALAIVTSAPELRSVALEFWWDDQRNAKDIATLIEEGHDLAAARGEVSLWVRGTQWEDRLVVVVGRCREPEYGARGEPISLTVEDEPLDDLAFLVDATVNSEAWPLALDEHYGDVYPFVFGAPGVFQALDGTTYYCPGSPAICVQQTAKKAETLLIAGHHVAATQVYITYNTGSSSGWEDEGPFSVTNTFDGVGRPCATVDVTGASLTLQEAGEYYTAWSGGAAAYDRFGTGALQSAGQLLRNLAAASTVSVDAAAFAAVADRLPWLVAGFIDDPEVSPLQYLQDVVLPMLPVGLMIGDSGGLAPVLWRYDATQADAVDHLEVGPGVSRVSRVRYERPPREIAQRIHCSFAIDGATDRPHLHYELHPERSLAEESTSAFAIASARRYVFPGEVLRSLEVELPIVWSASTAARVAHWRIRRDGYAPRLVEYDVLADRGWLRPGDVVTITDSELAWVTVVALIVERRVSDIGVWRLTLQILDPLVSGSNTKGPGANGAPTWTPPGGN